MSDAQFVVELLTDHHETADFDSGHKSLDDWLRKSARHSDGRDITRTYVLVERASTRVAGYYALQPYTIDAADLTKRQKRGLPNRIPVYLLARLALDRSFHGQRLGTQLLVSAMLRVASGREQLSGRYLVVDALDDRTISFYAHHGFQPVEGIEGRLVLPLKDLTA